MWRDGSGEGGHQAVNTAPIAAGGREEVKPGSALLVVTAAPVCWLINGHTVSGLPPQLHRLLL